MSKIVSTNGDGGSSVITHKVRFGILMGVVFFGLGFGGGHFIASHFPTIDALRTGFVTGGILFVLITFLSIFGDDSLTK